MKVRLFSAVAVALAMAIVAAFPGVARAQEAPPCKTWVGGVSNSWGDAGNWNPSGVPTSTDNVCITGDGSYTVVVTGGRSAASVTLGSAGNSAQPTLWIRGGTPAGSATLTVAGDLVNRGTIRLETTYSTYSSNLTATSGTLVNLGIINVNPGTGGPRTISANLDNQGTVNANDSLTLSRTGGSYSNSGTFNVAVGQTLTITGNSQQFNQNGGTLVILGTFPITGATFNYNGGAITGTPDLRSSNLNLGAVATEAATFITRAVVNLSGDLKSGQTILVKGGSIGGYATLTSANGFTNAGTITLETEYSTYYSNLTVTSGTLTNTGTINVNRGTGGGRTISGDLDNQGTVNANYNLTLSRASGSYTNSSGSFNVGSETNSAPVLTISGNSQQFNQNGGTLALFGRFDMTSATFNYNGGTITGTPELTSATLNLASAAIAPATFIARAVVNLAGDVKSGHTILVRGGSDGGYATLISANGFTNAGTITLETEYSTYYSNLAVTNGTLTNTGTINVNKGSGGSRTISANLDNQGTVNVNYPVTLQKAGGSYINSGTVRIATSATAPVPSLTITGNSQQFNQNGGGLVILGTFNMTSATFNYNGGTITGTPQLLSSNLNLGAGATEAATFIARAVVNLTGDPKSGQTILVKGGAVGGYATLVAANGFTNGGTITLETDYSTYYSNLTVTSGTLTNLGTINVNRGTGGSRTISANLDNQGTVNVNDDLTLSKASGTYANSGGIFNVGAGQTLTISGSSQQFNQNGGTLAVFGSFEMTSATFNFNGGTVTGAPDLIASNLNLGNGAVEPATFNTRAVVNLSGNVKAGQTILVKGGAVGGYATLVAANGFTNGGTITLETDYSTYYSNLTVTSGTLTNLGTINANAGTGGSRTISGDLTNQGTVNVNHNLTHSGNLVNQGTVNLNKELTLNRSGSSYTNAGTINVPVGGTLSIDNGTFRQVAPGSISGGGAVVVGGGGRFYGVGSVQANVTNNGRLGAGASPGILNIIGNYTNSYYAYLEVEIGGPEPGTGYDRLNVSGAATLAGNLAVTMIDGYLPGPCDDFRIVTWGSRSGSFGTMTGLGGPTAGYYLRPDYNPNDLTLLAYDPNSKVNVRPLGVEVAEGGATAQYRLCLKDQPTADVTVTASPDAQVTASPAVLTFSLADLLNRWNVTRTVTVAAVDDLVTEPSPHSGTISHVATSADAGYNGVSVASVTARIADNDAPPVASNGSATTLEDASVEIALVATDPDSPSLTFTIVSPPARGSLGPASGNRVTYAPNANYFGPDSFTFRANDGANDSNVAAISITVTPVNDAPVANAHSVSTPEDTPKPLALAGSDVEGDPLTYTVVSGPANGALSGTAPNLTYTPNANYNGPDSFTFRVNDGTLESAVATVSIGVTPVNDPPVANDQSVTTAEDTPRAITLTGSDVEGDSLTYAVMAQPTNGTLTGTAPNLIYTPNANYNGPDGFTFKVSDGQAEAAVATVSITVTPVNDSPVANAQAVETAEDTAKAITLAGSDVDGDALTYTVVTPPANGSLSGTAPNLTYTPNANYNGPDSFTFKVNDGQVDSAVATVSITVTAVNDPPVAANDAYATNEDTVLSVAAPGVLGNDSDVDSLTLTAVQVNPGPANGTVVLNGNGSFTYTPNLNFNGTDSFHYKVTDGTAESAEPGATVTITVTPVNDAPVANDQSATTPEDTARAVTLTGSDVDGDTLTYMVVAQPVNGTVSGTAPNLTYTPNANYNGADSFTFKVNDGTVDSNVATVSITVTPVNDTPVAYDQSVTTAEDTPKAITLAGSDADGDSLTFAVMAPPTNGTLSGTAPNLTYTPNASYSGPDSLTFKVSDGRAEAAVATVSITVTPVNDAPVANAQSVETAEDTPKAITLVGTDLDGDPLTYAVVSGPANGTLSGMAPNLTYTPNANYNGPDSFTFKVNDGALDSNVATVSITMTPVNDPPVAADDGYATTEDTVLNVAVPGVLGNDSDVDSLTLTAVQVNPGPANGTVVLNGNGSFTYTPNPNFAGTDSFHYKVTDGTAESAEPGATVTITVTPVNDPPVASDQSVATPEDTPKSITLSGSDVEGNSLTYMVVAQPAKGTLSGTAPNVTYTPNANYNGPDSFTFKVNDGTLDSNVATVSITVTPVNDAPVANAQPVTTAEDTSKAITLSGSDLEGSSLTYTVVTQPANGTLAGTAPNLTYTPKPNYNGPDAFTFKVNDGQADSNVATVSIAVTPVNDPPTANAGPDQTVDEGASVSLPGSGTDVDGNALTYSWTQTAGPTVTLSNPNSTTASFTAPGVDADTLLTFQLAVSDGTATATDSVNVTVRNTGPTSYQAARTIGYWKNHEDQLRRILGQGSISLGDTTVTTVAQAVQVLSNSDAKDARNALRAQLLATALNLRNGSDPRAGGTEIRPVVDSSKVYLSTHPRPVEGKDPARREALALKDKLDAYNNSGG